MNLIYAVFFQLQTKESFFENIAQEVEKRIEIDYVELRGTAFEGWDQRAVLAHLVRAGLAEAVCFLSDGSSEPPIDVLHKKSVVLAPGTFEHLDLTHAGIHERLLSAGIQQLREEQGEKDSVPTGFFCLSAMPLRDADPPPEIANLLERIEALRARGGTVLLFRDRELYSMTTLVNRYTKERVRFVVGLSLLVRIWEYRNSRLPGSFLEALARLLAQNVCIYAYPMRSSDLEQAIQSISATGWQWTDTDGWVSARQLHPPTPLNHLYNYVFASNFFVPIDIPADLHTDAATISSAAK